MFDPARAQRKRSLFSAAHSHVTQPETYLKRGRLYRARWSTRRTKLHLAAQQFFICQSHLVKTVDVWPFNIKYSEIAGQPLMRGRSFDLRAGNSCTRFEYRMSVMASAKLLSPEEAAGYAMAPPAYEAVPVSMIVQRSLDEALRQGHLSAARSAFTPRTTSQPLVFTTAIVEPAKTAFKSLLAVVWQPKAHA